MTQRDRREDGQRHREEKHERTGGEARQDRALVSVQSQNRLRRTDDASKRWTETPRTRPEASNQRLEPDNTAADSAGGEEAPAWKGPFTDGSTFSLCRLLT